MRLLIDGYNLLHATDLFGAGELAGTLRGSREALIDFLGNRLTEKERRAAVIVFDAKDALPGLPDRYDHDGIQIRFARGYPDADAMIEEILENAKGTKQLTVVSGDRRVQRAARSRGAKPIDSDLWFNALCRRAIGSPSEKRSQGPIGSNEQWVQEFSDPEALAEIERQAASDPLPKMPPARLPTASADSPAELPKKNRRRAKSKPPFAAEEKTSEEPSPFGDGILNPFPEGYADDLVQGFSEADESEFKSPQNPNKPDDPHDAS